MPVDVVDDRGESTKITWTEVPAPAAVTRHLLQMETADGWEVTHSFGTDTLGSLAEISNWLTGLEVAMIDALKRGR